MELSDIFGFFKILGESIKLLPRNGKLMAEITVSSLILPSILIALFSYFFESNINHMTNSITNYSGLDSGFYLQIILYLIMMFCIIVLISDISGLATIIVSAMSYTDKKVSVQDLIPRIKTTWRRYLFGTFRRAKSPARYAFLAVMIVFLSVLYRNLITIIIATVLAVSVCIFQLYSSVVWALSHVVSILEDVYEGTAAVEKAEELVKGQRHHGFMINLFFNLVFLIAFLGCWMMFANNGFLNIPVYGLFLVNSLTLGRIWGSIVYTVLYFQCKKHHGQEIYLVENFEYTKLSDVKVGSDLI